MSKGTYGELFAGVGGASKGLSQAGYKGAWAIDYNQGALDILKANHDIDLIIHDDVCNVDYSALSEVDVLWASPVCCNFSGANHNRGETYDDHRTACTIVEAASRAQFVIVENVPAYRKSDAFKTIVEGLAKLGYSDVFTPELEASDFGNPSRRLRFYAVFSRCSYLPSDELTAKLMVKMEPKTNWFSSLVSAVKYWEKSSLTANQIQAIESAHTSMLYPHKPFAIERCGYYQSPKIIPSSSIFPCLKAHPGHDGKNRKIGYGKIGSYRRQYDFVHEGQSYALTPQLMGLLMGFPINYNWGDNKAQAVAGIGNAVTPIMSKLIAGLL